MADIQDSYPAYGAYFISHKAPYLRAFRAKEDDFEPENPHPLIPEMQYSYIQTSKLTFTTEKGQQQFTIFFTKGGRQALISKQEMPDAKRISSSMDEAHIATAFKILRLFELRIGLPLVAKIDMLIRLGNTVSPGFML